MTWDGRGHRPSKLGSQFSALPCACEKHNYKEMSDGGVRCGEGKEEVVEGQGP